MNSARSKVLVCLLLLVIASVASIVHSTPTYAAQITSRSLKLVSSAGSGGSKAGGVVNHLLTFTLPTSASVGSIKFLYCTTATGTCTMPTGILTTSSTLSSQSGATGFTIVNATNGAPYITRAATSITGPLPVSYQLNSVTNPSAANQSFFIRIASYSSTDTTGSPIDTGTVTASTANQIFLNGIMPESLVFCTGAAISLSAGVPDCTTATAGNIQFDQLFSPADTASAQSQMAASTNAGGGYAISVNGATLTSGTNTITAMSTAGPGVRGSNQFGMNLKANTTATTTVARGVEATPAANGTNYRGEATNGYNTVDNFKFQSADIVADSANGGAGASDAQIFTISYIVNVPGSQPAGTYTTTLSYICTATY